MKLAELFVEIAANTASLGSAIGGAENSLRTFGASAAALGAAAGAAFMDAMKGAIEEAMRLQGEFIQVDKAIDLGPAMGQFKEDLFAMATDLKGVSLQSLIDIAIGAGKGGIAKDQILEFTEGVAKLSVALDDVPADKITDSLLQVNAAYKLPMQTMINLGSAIDKVADSGALGADQLFETMKKVGGSAKLLGLAPEELTGLAGTLLNSGGVGPDAAADSLRELFNRLSNPEAVRGLAEVLGVEFEDLKQQILTGPMAVIDQLLRKLAGQDAFGAREILFEKMGMQSQNAAEGINKLAQSLDRVGEFTAMAAEQLKTGAQATDGYTKGAQRATAEQQAMQNAIDIAQAKIGDAFLPAVSEMFKLLSDVAGAFADNSDATESWGETLINVIRDVRAAMADLTATRTSLGLDILQGVFDTFQTQTGKDLLAKALGFNEQDIAAAKGEAQQAIADAWNQKGDWAGTNDGGGVWAEEEPVQVPVKPAFDPELKRFQEDFEYEIGFGPRPAWMGPEENDNFDFPTLPVEEQIEAWKKDNEDEDKNRRRSAMSLEEFGNSLLNSALNDDQAKRQADLTERVAKGVEQMERNLGRFVDLAEFI